MTHMHVLNSSYLLFPFMPSMLAADACIAAVGSSIGTAVGVSVSVTFVVSFSMGVLVASVLCYISRGSKESNQVHMLITCFIEQ